MTTRRNDPTTPTDSALLPGGPLPLPATLEPDHSHLVAERLRERLVAAMAANGWPPAPPRREGPTRLGEVLATMPGVGAPAYMAPERVEGAVGFAADRADVWEVPALAPRPVLTADEVRERCGLTPWLEFGRSKVRCRGRTTRMLCEAVAVASTGRVVLLLGHGRDTDRIVRQAREMARACGVPETRMRPSTAKEEHENPGACVFVDHYAREMDVEPRTPYATRRDVEALLAPGVAADAPLLPSGIAAALDEHEAAVTRELRRPALGRAQSTGGNLVLRLAVIGRVAVRAEREEQRRAVLRVLEADRGPFARARRAAVMAYCERHDVTPEHAATILQCFVRYEELRGVGAKPRKEACYYLGDRALAGGPLDAYERERGR